MVLPPGISRLARSTSTWIHWWSPVASANLLIVSWSMVTHSETPKSSPIWFFRSFGVSITRMLASSLRSGRRAPEARQGRVQLHAEGVERHGDQVVLADG